MEKQPPQGDIRSVIRACYDKMTATEKAIADYFLGDVPIENLSPKSLTARLYVSKATLTRFANRCGFEGYREFVYHYKTGRVQQPGGSSFTQLTRKVIETYQAIFDRTRALIDEDQLERIARMLVCSDQRQDPRAALQPAHCQGARSARHPNDGQQLRPSGRAV